jgi:hypothetical protein
VRISMLLVPALALALIPRIMASDADVSHPDIGRLLRDMSAAFGQQGYTAVIERRLSMDNVQAERGDCSLSAMADFTTGSRLSAFRLIQPAGRNVQFNYRGEWRPARPRLRPALDYYLQQALARVGMRYDYSPVMMVSADPACDLATLDLHSLRLFPGG